ncbi:MAG TPA: three-Cys-motif partner protein TcmP [Candidatus Acidoferrales bacterium]|nr:three-Cys-motif partner protein TcmP [Candidatus Acidoferrales bacterium]
MAKIEIVRRYVYLWFSILASHPGKRLVYIDGFAGPGEYTNNVQGSPLAALAAAKDALERPGSGLQSKECCFLFVEKRRKFAAHLRALISKTTWPPQFKWEVVEGTFEEQVGGILEQFKSGRQQLAPTFAFIDPFGATGLPFKVVADILSGAGDGVGDGKDFLRLVLGRADPRMDPKGSRSLEHFCSV